MSYWKECVEEAFEDAGIEATQEQIDTVASWFEGDHENYGMAHGHDQITSPCEDENIRLKEELAKERSKVDCPDCSGKGRILTRGPYHSSNMHCSKCRGEGRICQ